MRKYSSRKRLDLKGQKFGKLTVIDEHPIRRRNGREGCWICKCECGREKVASTANLRNGSTKSCGCMRGGSCYIHGFATERLYHIYRGMIARCSDKKKPHYYNKGITVCDEWKNDYLVFRSWALLNGYNENLTIDRINGNGNYLPENCRWVTMKQQQRNRSDNRMITYQNQTKTAAEWCEIFGIPTHLMHNRLRYKWPIEKIISTPCNILFRSKYSVSRLKEKA